MGLNRLELENVLCAADIVNFGADGGKSVLPPESYKREFDELLLSDESTL